MYINFIYVHTYICVYIYTHNEDIYTYICVYACVCAKSLQLCPILCDPTNCSLSGSSVHGILQLRMLE